MIPPLGRRSGQIEHAPTHARTHSVIHIAYRIPSQLLTMVAFMAVQPFGAIAGSHYSSTTPHISRAAVL